MVYKELKENKKSIIPNKLSAVLICAMFVLLIFAGFLVSRFDVDRTVSVKENRTLASKPKISIVTFFNGSFSEDFDEYFSDTFPLRDGFLDINAKLSGFFSKNSGGDDMVLVEKQEKDDFAGQNID